MLLLSSYFSLFTLYNKNEWKIHTAVRHRTPSYNSNPCWDPTCTGSRVITLWWPFSGRMTLDLAELAPRILIIWVLLPRTFLEAKGSVQHSPAPSPMALVHYFTQIITQVLPSKEGPAAEAGMCLSSMPKALPGFDPQPPINWMW